MLKKKRTMEHMENKTKAKQTQAQNTRTAQHTQ